MKRYQTLLLGLIISFSFNMSFGQTAIAKSIVANAETLSYFDNGKGKITLLFIHGSFINKEYWNKQVSYFSSKYRVVAMDLAGHGNSTHNRKDWTIQEYGKDVNELIKKLALKNVIIIGHSVGGDIMLETVNANNTAVIGLVGIDYFKNVGAELPQKSIDQIIGNLKTDFAATNEQYAKKTLLTAKTDASIVDKVLTDFRTMNPKIGIRLNVDFFNYPKREIELLKILQTKLYLINVNYSPTDQISLKKYIGNNYELNILNGSCHYPMIENPKEFNSLLENTILKIKGQKEWSN